MVAFRTPLRASTGCGGRRQLCVAAGGLGVEAKALRFLQGAALSPDAAAGQAATPPADSRGGTVRSRPPA